MAQKTVGIDIGNSAVRVLICALQERGFSLISAESYPRLQGDEAELSSLLQAVEARLNQEKEIIAMGVSADPSLVLSASRVFPFSDPKVLDKILPQSMSETWTIDQNSLLTFELRGESKPSEGAEAGHLLHVLHYPKDVVQQRLQKLKAHNLDPQLLLPANEALDSVASRIFKAQTGAWGILDIGSENATLSLFSGMRCGLTRSFRIAGQRIDKSLAQAFHIEVSEARHLKESTGFVAPVSQEAALYYQDLIPQGLVEAWDVDPVLLSQSCSKALQPLVSNLRQSLARWHQDGMPTPDCLYLTGHGARLANLGPWLSQNLALNCQLGLPLLQADFENVSAFSLDALVLAIAASPQKDKKNSLNLRRGNLAHKGNLAFLKENKWLLLSLVLFSLAAGVLSIKTHIDSVKAEHARLKAALENSSTEVFGSPVLSVVAVNRELEKAKSYSFIPERTAFTHFEWISNQINDNLMDVEMDLSHLDISTLQKTVTIRGEIKGDDDGLGRVLQVLESYECFPNEIQEPRTNKVQDRTVFTLRIDMSRCAPSGDSNE